MSSVSLTAIKCTKEQHETRFIWLKIIFSLLQSCARSALLLCSSCLAPSLLMQAASAHPFLPLYASRDQTSQSKKLSSLRARWKKAAMWKWESCCYYFRSCPFRCTEAEGSRHLYKLKLWILTHWGEGFPGFGSELGTAHEVIPRAVILLLKKFQSWINHLRSTYFPST